MSSHLCHLELPNLHRIPKSLRFTRQGRINGQLCKANASPLPVQSSPGTSLERLLKTVPGGRAEANLEAADRFWHQLCNSDPGVPRQVIREVTEPLPRLPETATFDVVVLGGTLGIILATALQLKGRSVAVVERNALLGRDQEWNISRADMRPFVDEGILTANEVEEVIISEFNPVRVAFEGIAEIVTDDILNCGVSPKRIVEILKQRFLDAGGRLFEWSSFEEARVHPEGVMLDITRKTADSSPPGAGGAGGAGNLQMQSPEPSSQTTEQVRLSCRVVVDALGGFSPIAKQARGGRKPDSVVLMVGSCSTGLPEPQAADLLYSFNPLNRKRGLQYFWETFPASDGVTTYMFCYCDPVAGRASLREMFEDYLDLLPSYQGCEGLEGVEFRRAMFGVVPNWHDSPLQPITSRLLHVGDSAGNRSALSFAGFGAMARHLKRLRQGLDEALGLELTDVSSLRLLQPHSPAISLTAAMQFSMGTRRGQQLEGCDEHIINNYIGGSFRDMRQFGPQVYRPFMQDYLQWGSMARVVGKQLVTQPKQLLDMTLFMRSATAGTMFASNFAQLFLYDTLFRVARFVAPAHEKLLPPRLLYRWRRLVEAFEYGSANDYSEGV